MIARTSSRPPWTLVSGSFHRHGGMDKANLAFAEFLSDLDIPVHIVSHDVDCSLRQRNNVHVHCVKKTASSFLLSEHELNRRGREVAADVCRRWPQARVLVNGGNCDWPDINWVHFVHQAHSLHDSGMPLWARAKNRIANTIARHRELAALSKAKLVFTNSDKTRRDLTSLLKIDSSRIFTVHLGNDPGLTVSTDLEHRAAKVALGIPETRPVVAFVGAMGLDHRKGFDILIAAWNKLCIRGGWDPLLIVAGGGRGVERWKSRVTVLGLEKRVRFLGFSNQIAEVLAASDLLVSPTRYEPLGLNVQEAIGRGVPVLVSKSAGVTEWFGPELDHLLLSDPENVTSLAERLLYWRENISALKAQILPLQQMLGKYSWQDMARTMFEIAIQTEREFDSAHRPVDDNSPLKTISFHPETAPIHQTAMPRVTS